jgi:hypothetical protein
LFELMRYDELLKSFLLLSSSKIAPQDTIWRHICQDLDWQYIPTKRGSD